MSRTMIPHNILLISMFILVIISQASGVSAGINAGTSIDGEKRLTVIAANAGGMVSHTHPISNNSIPPGGVALDGPLTGTINTAYTFTATVNPPITTMPITYTWAATEQSNVVQVMDSPQTGAGFTWSVIGAKVITVTAINQGGQVSSLPHTIQIITPWNVFLPFVVRTTPPCPGNVLINGDFEQGHTGWYTYTTGSWWKQHDLIGSDAEGFVPYQGHYAAGGI